MITYQHFAVSAQFFSGSGPALSNGGGSSGQGRRAFAKHLKTFSPSQNKRSNMLVSAAF
jgi:hypothetical protein